MLQCKSTSGNNKTHTLSTIKVAIAELFNTEPRYIRIHNINSYFAGTVRINGVKMSERIYTDTSIDMFDYSLELWYDRLDKDLVNQAKNKQMKRKLVACLEILK